MSLPEWAEEVIAAHSIFLEAGIDVGLEWNDERKRVEAVCRDIPPYIFPSAAWYVTKRVWDSGKGPALLKTQLNYLQEYLNEH